MDRKIKVSEHYALRTYSTEQFIDLDEILSDELLKVLDVPTLLVHKNIFLPNAVMLSIVQMIDELKDTSDNQIESEEYNIKIMREAGLPKDMSKLDDSKIGYWFVNDDLHGYICTKYL